MSNIDVQDTWRQNYASLSWLEFTWGSQLNRTDWPFVAWVSLIRLLKSLCERSSLKLAWLFHRRRQDCAFVSVSPDDTPENETKPGTAGAVEKFNNVPVPQPTCQGTPQVRCHRVVLCSSDCTHTSVESNKQRVEADTLPSTHTNVSVLSHGLPGRYQLSIRGDVSDVSIPFRPRPGRPTDDDVAAPQFCLCPLCQTANNV